MIDYIKGEIAYKDTEMLVIESGGIGFQLHCTTTALQNAGKTGESAKVFVQMIVREDSMTLYGFTTRQEREMFNKITGVSGIGAKIAINVLSSMTTAELAIALVTEDISSITKVKGIGPKTAKRMILELKEKVDNDELTTSFAGIKDAAGAPASIEGEAVSALMALGFSSIEASRAVKSAEGSYDSVEQLITAALRTRGA
ncbi:MAG: Holliday junction branch migration protein RuvA [Clostridia bacterium]|nr:Holliday junction branch migration protein RuvA [Clostridia bacterium]